VKLANRLLMTHTSVCLMVGHHRRDLDALWPIESARHDDHSIGGHIGKLSKLSDNSNNTDKIVVIQNRRNQNHRATHGQR
jgi:hypothetical protein